MSFGGRLETLDLPGLLQTLSAGSSSGRLTLTRLERHAVLVLRAGRVVYVTGGAASETLAGRLLRQRLVEEKDLMRALERQHDGTGYRRLGEVLVELGLLAEGTLQAVVRQRMQELLNELLAWRTGFFRFEPARAGAEADIEVDMGDFVLEGGLQAEELLMRAVTALDHGELQHAPPNETLPPFLAPRAPGTNTTLTGTGSYAADFTGEAVLSLLRFASQVLARAVVFAIEGEQARAVGEFGISPKGVAALRDTAFSVREPSVLKVPVERRRSYTGPLEPTRVNLQLADALAGGTVHAAVSVPLVVQGEVRYVLYGDNAPLNRPFGPLDALESAAARAARIVEKTLLARVAKPRNGGI